MASSSCNCWSHVTKSTSPYPSSSVPKSPSNKRSMEQVWKEIKLASFCNCSTDMDDPTPSTRSAFHNVILHEFLARPFNKDSSATTCGAYNPISATDSSFLKQAQPTLLGLSSRSVFQKHSHDSFLSSFDNLKSSIMYPSDGKKSVQQDMYDSSDQRHKRLIKNRESAARSRARKQVYKNEMETKIACLMEENSRLRRQIQELQSCLKFSANPSKMRTLYRTSTSPF